MITKKPKRKTYVSRVTSVQSDNHGHTLVTIMNSPHAVLFSNADQLMVSVYEVPFIFWNYINVEEVS